VQQPLVQWCESLELPVDSREPMKSLTESSLLLQIQALTEQLLASTAATTGIMQPPSETASNDASSKVQCLILLLAERCNTTFACVFYCAEMTEGRRDFRQRVAQCFNYLLVMFDDEIHDHLAYGIKLGWGGFQFCSVGNCVR